MDSNELVRAAYQKYHHIAEANGWTLLVKWSGTNVVYGCKVCAEMVSAGRIKMQPRYKEEDTPCLAHANFHGQIARNIKDHHNVKTHKQAICCEINP